MGLYGAVGGVEEEFLGEGVGEGAEGGFGGGVGAIAYYWVKRHY